MAQQRRLADYLRARRERLRPEDVGIAVGDGNRRVTGLRREEVAILAGISTDYYLRLEQGRNLNPSDQVLGALARALQLDPVATAYLHGLAGLQSDAESINLDDVVDESTQWLIDSWPLTAAIIHNRYLDVLASNSLAAALDPNYRRGHNTVLRLFADPAERLFHADWDGLAARSVALLRTMAGTHGDDARLSAVVAEGSAASAQFREFWDNQEVIGLREGVHVLHHPQVGELILNFLHLPLVGPNSQSLFLYFAGPGTASEAALRQLAASG